MNDMAYLTATKIWLNEVVIGLNLCPFAKQERDTDSIRFSVLHDTGLEDCLANVMDECVLLDKEAGIQTTLIIYAQAFANFDDYLDFLALAEELLRSQGYEGIYQLASFHPQYCFADVSEHDPSNYTNRSPYPILHLLREDSIAKAMAHHPNPDNIPQRNIELTRQLGLATLQNLLTECYTLANKRD